MCVLCLGYAWLNAAISLDAARSEQGLQRARIALLKELLRQTSTGMSRTDLERLVEERRTVSGHIVKQGTDRLQIDDVIFRFDGKAVTDVTLIDNDVAK